MKLTRYGEWTGALLVVCLLPSARTQADDALLTADAQTVLKTYCWRCHGKDGAAKGKFDYVLDRDRLLSRNKVVPGKPADSELYRKVRDGEMPPAEQKLRPGKGEIALLERWIAAGAPAFRATALRPPLPETELHRLILADLHTVAPRHRRFLRYLSVTHLANAGLGDSELRTTRLALAKLLNSLSWHPRLFQPHAVDPGQTVFRVDLRDLKWNTRLWDRVLALYPYRLAADGAEVKAITTATGSEVTHIRADWFIATASRPPLYHDLLQLPSTDRQLERLLQIDVSANIQEDRVARAGFTDSGVSKNNRLIERHDGGYGAYWRSYDFSDNRERQNLFDHPLGPALLGQNSFIHAGGEIIFNLPNGLQAYLLVDGNGRRIDQAPVEIVSDPKRPDRKVENGLSCMSCHVRGIIPKADQVRAHVTKNPRAFSKTDAETVQALHPPDTQMQALMKEDIQRFENALAKLGISPEQHEPSTLVTQRYEGVLDLSTAAAEVGLSSAEFAKRLDRSAALTRSVGALRVKGGTVQRETFQAAFPELVRELRPESAIAPALLRGSTASILSIAIAPDGRQAVFGCDDRTVRLWDVDAGRELRSLEGQADEVSAVAFAPDGRRIASGGSDRIVRVWETVSGKLLHRFTGHGDKVRAVAFSGDGQRVLSGSQDGTLRLWNLARARTARSFAGHVGGVSCVAFSPDGLRLLSGGQDGTVRVWDAESGRVLLRLEGHGGEVLAVSFSPDGRTVLSGGNDRTIRLWDVRTGNALRRFEGHGNAVIRVAFSPDGKQVFSASSQYQTPDKTFRVWDAASGRELYALGGAETDRIGCAAFAPDGRFVLWGGSDLTPRLGRLSK